LHIFLTSTCAACAARQTVAKEIKRRACSLVLITGDIDRRND
jgi:hypothetical protein